MHESRSNLQIPVKDLKSEIVNVDKITAAETKHCCWDEQKSVRWQRIQFTEIHNGWCPVAASTSSLRCCANSHLGSQEWNLARNPCCCGICCYQTGLCLVSLPCRKQDVVFGKSFQHLGLASWTSSCLYQSMLTLFYPFTWTSKITGDSPEWITWVSN